VSAAVVLNDCTLWPHVAALAAQILPHKAAHTTSNRDWSLMSACRNPWALLKSHPTLLVFHGLLGASAEAAFAMLCLAGSALGFAVACGAVHPLMFTALWMLYLSVASVGQAFLPQPG
jgi:hypothetical protein